MTGYKSGMDVVWIAVNDKLEGNRGIGAASLSVMCRRNYKVIYLSLALDMMTKERFVSQSE